MRPLCLAVAVAVGLALASMVSADSRFAPPTAFKVVADPEDLEGSKLLATWAPPASPPPAGFQLSGYRLQATHPGDPFTEAELVPNDLTDSEQLFCDLTKTKAAVEGLEPSKVYSVSVEAVYTPANTPLVCAEEQPTEPSIASHAVFSDPAVLAGVKPIGRYFDPSKIAVLIAVVLYGLIVVIVWTKARKRDLYIRPIPGLRAVDDAIGRATEMGKPLVYVAGLGGVGTIPTIAAMLILGHLARRTAAYATPVLAPCNDPLVMSIEREIVREAYLEAGRPDAFRPDDIFFLTDSQFGYVAAVDGIIMRERPAACFYMGQFFAEALILAETGNTAGSVQIAGTDSDTQLPFFITSCDYTLMGEELYAAGAYLSRHPLLVAQLKGQDIGKSVLAAVLALGVAFATFAALGHGAVMFEAFKKALASK